MDDVGEAGDDSKRKTRNASEKKRRDQFNILVTELGTMVSPGNRKMDKTTVLKSTIAFLRQHSESSAKSQLHEIREDWKPSFLSNEEFTHLMLESLEGFILALTTEGTIVYASESITSLLGYLPGEVAGMSIYELVSEADKPGLYSSLMGSSNLAADEDDEEGSEVHFLLHMKREGLPPPAKMAADEDDPAEDPGGGGGGDGDVYELVRLSGFFRRWPSPENGDVGIKEEVGDGSDDDNASCKSSFSRLSNNGGGSQVGAAPATGQGPSSRSDRMVLVATARLQTAQLLREIPLVHSSASAKSEFTSRYSMEWKFLFLDHRAPQIIGYLPFELLGTSGYDYYHFDDLDRISQCHEALMQTGEGTSCYHRFLSKGQQWIWLQTRYYITYHQWNSKPEFVVATHKVVNYTDVVRELRRHGGDKLTNGEDSEAGSADVRSSKYPTTGSPTWSSRSSIFGGSSTGTGGGGGGMGTSSRMSDRQQKFGFNDGASSGPGEDFYPGGEFDSISHYIRGGAPAGAAAPGSTGTGSSGGGGRRQHRQHRHQQGQQQQPSGAAAAAAQQGSSSSQVTAAGGGREADPSGFAGGAFQMSVGSSDAAATAPVAQAVTAGFGAPQPVLIAAPPGGQAMVAAAAPAGSPEAAAVAAAAAMRQQVAMTPAQVQLQEQLRTKHTELTRRIAEQQQELSRISEQLVMSQYGLVPVGVTFAPVVPAVAITTATNSPAGFLPAPAAAAGPVVQQGFVPAAAPAPSSAQTAVSTAGIGFPILGVASVAALQQQQRASAPPSQMLYPRLEPSAAAEATEESNR